MKLRGKVLRLMFLACAFLLCCSVFGSFMTYKGVLAQPTSSLAESFHPYANNYENTWTISKSGVAEIRIHFTKIELKRRDYVKILDKDKKELTTYGDYYHDVSLEDVWTEWYTGDTLKVKLKTNSSGTAYGFLVDKKETRGTAPPPEPGTCLAESFHPYANNYENTWTISKSGVAEIRIHFTKIELKRRDYVKILDKDKKELTTYGDYYHDVSLEDVWTEWYTGDTLKVKLKTNSSGTAYGFLVDKKETRGTAPPPEPTPTPNHAPIITSLSAGQEEIIPGGSTTISAAVNDPDGDIVTYSWTCNGGALEGKGATVTWNAPSSEGLYNIGLEVSDGRGGVEGSSISIRVASGASLPSKPGEPGSVMASLHANRTRFNVGEEIVVQLAVTNPAINPMAKIQLVLDIPSGLAVTSVGYEKGGAGGLWSSPVYNIEPTGDVRNIMVTLVGNEPFKGTIKGKIFYYFEGQKPEEGRYVDVQLDRLLEVSHKSTPSEIPPSTPSAEEGIAWWVIPAGIVVFAAIVGVVRLVLKKE